MAIERRRNPKPGAPPAKAADLPPAYLRMVGEVFASNFEPALEAIRGMGHKPSFAVGGAIFPDEILLTVTLLCEGELAATSVHASADFDPKASAPTAEQLLAACVDAAGGVLGNLLDASKPKLIESLLEGPLSALENAPFEWTLVTVNKRKLHVRVDKVNPALEKMADDWLGENDPDQEPREMREREAAEKLLVSPKIPVKRPRKLDS